MDHVTALPSNDAAIKRHNFVTYLPYDLARRIFEQLSLPERVECLRVCWQWRRFLLEERGGLWYSMDFYMMPLYGPRAAQQFINGPGDWLARLEPDQVQHFSYYGPEPDVDSAFNMLNSLHLRNLKTLSMKGNIYIYTYNLCILDRHSHTHL